jgi:hypothetical protein
MASDTEKTTHIGNPGYAPFGGHYKMAEHMEESAKNKKPRDILNLTALSFYTREEDDLNPDQIAAKANFIRTYQKVQKTFADHDYDNPDGPVPQWELTSFKEYFDAFFFFGCFAPMRQHVKVARLKSSGLHPAEKFGEGRLVVPVRNSERIFNLNEVLALLLHEMVHAYFEHYSCKCDKCTAANANTIGMDGDRHGPFFRILHRLILSEIRRWHADLKALDAEDCPGSVISTYSTDRADEAWKKLTSEEQRGYGKRKPAVLTSVSIGVDEDSNTVYVLPHFMGNQFKYESNRKAREGNLARHKRRAAAATSALDTAPPVAKRTKSAPKKSGVSASGADKDGEHGDPDAENDTDGDDSASDKIYSEEDA